VVDSVVVVVAAPGVAMVVVVFGVAGGLWAVDLRVAGAVEAAIEAEEEVIEAAGQVIEAEVVVTEEVAGVVAGAAGVERQDEAYKWTRKVCRCIS
jgi:hypothetical protein